MKTIELSTIAQALLHLIRIHLWGETADTSLMGKLTDEDWKALYALACEHDVVAEAYEGLRSLPDHLLPSQAVLQNWRTVAQEAENQSDKKRQVLDELRQQCADQHLPQPVVLGGVDRKAIDLWFPGYDLEADYLFSKMELSMNYDNPDYTTVLWQGVELRNHYSLQDQTLLDIWRAEGDSPLFQMLYNLRQIISGLRERFTLRQVIRWALLLHDCQGHYDRDKMLSLLNHQHLLRAMGILTFVAEQYLGLPHEAVLMNLRTYQEEGTRMLAQAFCPKEHLQILSLCQACCLQFFLWLCPSYFLPTSVFISRKSSIFAPSLRNNYGLATESIHTN